MGCDIHMVLEKRDDSFGWVGIDTFRGHESSNGKGWNSPAAVSRNYRRFAALAGVRGEGPEPRGVPHDASVTTRCLVKDWDGDGHSHSWLPLSEAAEIFKTARYDGDVLDPDSFEAKYPAAHFFGVDGEDMSRFRIVFWFDN